jgi:hypothetical protein
MSALRSLQEGGSDLQADLDIKIEGKSAMSSSSVTSGPSPAPLVGSPGTQPVRTCRVVVRKVEIFVSTFVGER